MHDLTSMRAFEALQEHKSLTAATKAPESAEINSQ